MMNGRVLLNKIMFKVFKISIIKKRNVSVFNGYSDLAIWFEEFLATRNINNKINLFSVFGRKYIVKLVGGKKVFFTGENVKERDVFIPYRDHLINDVNLSLGFEYLDHKNYMRFPLWMTYGEYHHFKASFTKQELYNYLQSINDIKTRNNTNRKDFAVLIARHDMNGIRTKILKLLNKISTTTCAGSFKNNTQDLKEKYDDNKMEYLKNFRFNICPENTNTQGYITEKIIESFICGCIPIYHGGEGKELIEPGIINPNSFLYYDQNNEEEFVNKIRELWENEDKYLDFIKEEPFLPTACDVIWDHYERLEQKLIEI